MSWVKSLSKSFREIRLIISPQSNQAAYGFAQKYVPQVRSSDPSFPFIVRECEGVDEYMIFGYRHGVEQKFPLRNLSLQNIEDLVSKQVSNSSQVNSTLN